MSNQPPLDEMLPEALADDRRRVSLVWVIPLVAVLAAAWLGYRTYAEQGEMVTISFQTAEGLVAGKTRVRFKDVDVGVVEAIELSPDLSKVKVQARLVKQVEDYLNDRARFWVVRPRLSGGQISGLSTLLGGTYIGVDLSSDGKPRRTFEGLETPPVVTATERGSVFVLTAEALGSLSVGSPVQYHGVEVGRVVAYELREPEGVEITVFVDAPHDARVGANTRFWNVSGVDVSLDANGLRLSTESLAAMLLGGVAFGTPQHTDVGKRADADARFRLYPDEKAAHNPRYERRQPWRMAFQGSVRGLLPGAPVEFRGIRIGEVREIRLQLDADEREAHIPVTVWIEPERLGAGATSSDTDEVSASERALWDRLVNGGLRAQLKTGSLITGALYIDLDFYPDAPPREIVWGEGIPEFPTVPAPLDELRGLLSRLSRLPLDQMGEDLSQSLVALRETMETTNVLMGRLDRETVSELNSALVQTRKTLVSAEKVLSPNSALQLEARRVLQELGSAARSFRIMADYLERHPEALIRGKGAGTQ